MIQVYLYYLLLTVPFFYWLYLGFFSSLGAEPIVTLNIQTGYVTLTLFLCGLWLGQAQRFLASHSIPSGWSYFYRWIYLRRRSLGIATGIYALMHFSTYLGKESFAPKAFEQIYTKVYLSVAFVALMILTVMTLTSNNLSVRLLKKKWKSVHRWVHLAALLILVHVLLIEKGNIPLLLGMTLPILPFELYRLFLFVKSRAQTNFRR